MSAASGWLGSDGGELELGIGEAMRMLVEVEEVREVDADEALVTLVWRIVDSDDRVVASASVDARWRDRTGSDGSEVAARSGEASLAELYGDRVLL